MECKIHDISMYYEEAGTGKPLLVLDGLQTVVVRPRQLSAWRFAVLDRAGHLLDLEQPVLQKALMNEWLDRVEEYTATAPTGSC